MKPDLVLSLGEIERVRGMLQASLNGAHPHPSDEAFFSKMTSARDHKRPVVVLAERPEMSSAPPNAPRWAILLPPVLAAVAAYSLYVLGS